jgi:large subunit ribosomal protein L3
MTNQITGTKLDMTQKFNSQGLRVVVTRVKVDPKIKLGEVFKSGEPVKVTGTTKGKGFTGVMKRWGFKGGPRTHGQSDRQRAPGSIGQGTDPGRVFPGKKMPGRAGHRRKTISGLKVFSLDDENHLLLVDGPVPGPRNGQLIVRKVKKVKKEPVKEVKREVKKEAGEEAKKDA